MRLLLILLLSLALAGCSGVGSLSGLTAGGCIGGQQAPPVQLNPPPLPQGFVSLEVPAGMHAALCVW